MADEPGKAGGIDKNENRAARVDMKCGVGVLVLHNGRILCGTRSDDGTVCGPGGHIEEGETPEQAAVREAQEEFSVTLLNLIPLGVYKASSGRYCDSVEYFADTFAGEPLADGEEMLGARWLTLEELQGEKLFPPFAESLELLEDLAINWLTASGADGTLMAEENEDGAPFGNKNAAGPHKGRKGKDGKPKEKGRAKESLPMTSKEKAKVGHDINNLYHVKYQGKRICIIRTRSNETDSPVYLYRFKNYGFDNYDIFSKEMED